MEEEVLDMFSVLGVSALINRLYHSKIIRLGDGVKRC